MKLMEVRHYQDKWSGWEDTFNRLQELTALAHDSLRRKMCMQCPFCRKRLSLECRHVIISNREFAIFAHVSCTCGLGAAKHISATRMSSGSGAGRTLRRMLQNQAYHKRKAVMDRLADRVL